VWLTKTELFIDSGEEKDGIQNQET
jgi:hypothetical protein